MTELSMLWRAFWMRPRLERARLLRAAVHLLRSQGARATLHRLRHGAERLDQRVLDAERYATWCRVHTPDDHQLEAMADASRRFQYRPLISIVTPVYNTDPKWLEPCAESLLAQAYDRWEWHVGNDGSTRPATLETLARLTSLDARIHVHALPSNQGISAATNRALASSQGEYVGLMDSDDALLPHALFRVVEHLNACGPVRPDVLYTDEDKLELDGSRVEPYFKPDWSPELAISNMFACHFLVASRRLVVEVGGFRPAFDFSQDHDLLLRLMERANRIDHVRDIVYHWRKIPQSGATIGSAKPAAHIAGRRALQDYLDRHRLAGEVVDVGPPGFYRARCRIDGEPVVSAVVDGTESASGPAGWPIDGVARVEETTTVDQARGEYLLFVAKGLQPADGEWLRALLEVLALPGVGVVGPAIGGEDGRLRELGLVLGPHGDVASPFAGGPIVTDGYFGSGITLHNRSAVSRSCLLTRRELFQRLGGFDTTLGATAQAIDYCLRVWEAGQRVAVTPWARLIDARRENALAVPAPDADRLRERWLSWFDRDPFYNPHLSPDRPLYRVRA